MKPFGKIKNYILNGPWESRFLKRMKKIELRVIWPLLAFAACYFGYISFVIFTR